MTRLIQLVTPRLGLVLALAAGMLVIVACDGDAATVEDAAVRPAATGKEAEPTPTPGEPTLEAQYLEAARDRLRRLAASSRLAAEVMADADVQSGEWRAQARTMLGEFRTHHGDAEQLAVPPGLEGVQAALIAATGPFDRAAELLDDGIESLVPALLQEAADAVASGLFAIEEAQVKIREAEAGG